MKKNGMTVLESIVFVIGLTVFIFLLSAVQTCTDYPTPELNMKGGFIGR